LVFIENPHSMRETWKLLKVSQQSVVWIKPY